MTFSTSFPAPAPRRPVLIRQRRKPRGFPLGWIGALASAVVAGAPGYAHAQVDEPDPDAPPHADACRRIHAAAESQAFLLGSPIVWVEGVHVPRVGDVSGMGLIVGGEYQLRAALSWSPIDLARGLLLIEQASTECRSIEAAARVRRVLELGDGVGELAARREERRVLDEARPRIDALVAHIEAQVTAGVGTRAELTDVRTEAVRLGQRLSQLDTDIAGMVEAGHESIDASRLLVDLAEYEAARIELEDELSTARRLSPWTVSLRGGVVPGDQVDWFGQISVGLNLGIVAHHVAENELVDARRDEIANDADELRAVTRRFLGHIRATLPGLREDLAHLDTLIDIQTRQRELLEGIETADADVVRTMSDLMLVRLESERVHLATLIATREAFDTELHEDE